MIPLRHLIRFLIGSSVVVAVLGGMSVWERAGVTGIGLVFAAWWVTVMVMVAGLYKFARWRDRHYAMVEETSRAHQSERAHAHG